VVKKNRPIILSIYFHSKDYNCYSSEDYHYLELAHFPDPEYNHHYYFRREFCYIRELVTDFFKWIGRDIKVNSYSSDDEIFIIYCSAFFVNKEHIEEIRKEFYADQAYARELYKNYMDRKEKLYYDKRQKEGYVNCTNHCPKSLNELKGNLNKEIIIDNLDYLGSGSVFGYFGHEGRKFWHDDIINEEYNKMLFCNTNRNRISQYLNHSNARHWMDNAENIEDHEEFRNSFLSQIELLS
jgi:hypothetical protein